MRRTGALSHSRHAAGFRGQPTWRRHGPTHLQDSSVPGWVRIDNKRGEGGNINQSERRWTSMHHRPARTVAYLCLIASLLIEHLHIDYLHIGYLLIEYLLIEHLLVESLGASFVLTRCTCCCLFGVEGYDLRTCIHVRMYTFAHICIRPYIRSLIHTYMHTYRRLELALDTTTSVHTCILVLYKHTTHTVRTRIHTQPRTVRTRIHSQTNMHRYTEYTQVYTCRPSPYRHGTVPGQGVK
jgi:hypothetical protein